MMRSLLCAAIIVVPFAEGSAQQPDSVPPASAPQQVEVAVPQSSLEFYAGARSNGGTDFMSGMQYSRRMTGKPYGGAGFLEIVWSDPTQWLLGALFQFTPTPRLMIETGPGLAINGGTDFLWRIGAEYDLKGRRLSLIPKAFFDFVHGTTVFGYGVAVAFGGR